MDKSRLSVAIAITFSSTSSLAGSYAVDARASAMGGTGVVSSTYLTAPFYNPALAAIYRRNDNVGLLLPSLGVAYSDENQLVDSIDTITELLETDLNNITQQTADELDAVMNGVQGSSARLEFGTMAAVGIPNSYVSATIFGKAYAESFVAPDIAIVDATISDSNLQIADRAVRSRVNAVSISTLEAGVTFAKYYNVLGQHMSFGVSPKIQRVDTYVYSASINNYDLKDVFENSTSEATFNMDVGVLWLNGPFRVGLSGTNLISRDIETQSISTSSGVMQTYSYQLEPQFTLGAGFVADDFSITADYDVNENERFDQFNDDTQWLRIGAELDVLRQFQLRAGYKTNLAYDGGEGTLTGGIGFTPMGLFGLDLAIAYTNADSMGAYANFLLAY